MYDALCECLYVSLVHTGFLQSSRWLAVTWMLGTELVTVTWDYLEEIQMYTQNYNAYTFILVLSRGAGRGSLSPLN